MYSVEGLATDRIAVVGKIHHALADGVASGNLMATAAMLQAFSETLSAAGLPGELRVVETAMAQA